MKNILVGIYLMLAFVALKDVHTFTELGLGRSISIIIATLWVFIGYYQIDEQNKK